MVLEKIRQSVWQQEEMPRHNPLRGDTQADAVIVGGGMCGLLCAYFLYRKGVENIILIDAGELCGGVTAGTTAKITSQHGLLYHKLLKGLGLEGAQKVLAANQNAIQHFGEIIRRERIDCGFTPCNSWVYTTDEQNLPSMEEEVSAVQKLGMDAAFDRKTELPFDILGAVRFPHQASFHPLKFALHISEILTGAGCKIYTHTKATAAKAGIVYTEKGNIRCKHIISASHYPFIDKHSLLFTQIYQSRSYLSLLQGAGTLKDMYVDCEDGGLTFRGWDGMILFGGYDHKTGQDRKEDHYQGLEKEARRLYPTANVQYMWSAQDCMTHDRIPYIGRYNSAGENIYIATGFNKWGMTASMAAAEIIADLITTGRSAAEDAFSLGRGDIGLQAGSFFKNAAGIAGGFLSHMLPPVKPVCTHMGCAVEWNGEEETWDCSCHGSRFDAEGSVISGPAQKPLERLREIEPS
ncbi:MAG: FAD-dependent oxidoreductase [Oscillospiraceae bacterium]|nr:FAD-dependent oxidoreductase [Oscillospiraceae bacterium]